MDYRQALLNHLDEIKVPSPSDKVYKDECVYSYDTPESETGLYVCLKSHYGIGKAYLERHYTKTKSCVYLHLKHDKSWFESVVQKREVTRLAIGVEGGFDISTPKCEIRKGYSVVVLPNFAIFPWPDDTLPDKVQAAINGILFADSLSEPSESDFPWDGEVRYVSKYAANLVQLNNGKRIPPGGWKCEKCDLTSNLWLNLTDGAILCGRKYYDGTGGNNHAAEHYDITRYPLAVKLGTITKEGKADIYSYEEGDMVIDPYLAQHLIHFGVNISNLEKSDVSMVELELDLNKKFGEWAKIQEVGTDLTPLYGPGFTGLRNLGNSCYMNSTMQVIFAVPEFVKRYVHDADQIFRTSSSDPVNDFNIQMSKLANGLLSGRYSKPPKNPFDIDSNIISPHMFKHVIGKNSATFSGKCQQDVQEFLLHLIAMVQRNSSDHSDPTQCFKVVVEDRFECVSTSQVNYTYRDEYCLPLSVPLEECVNKEDIENYFMRRYYYGAQIKNDPEEPIRARIDFMSCIEAFIQTELVDQFYSTALKGKTCAYKTTKITSFPPVLVLHFKKYTLCHDWTPVKLDIAVDVPDIIDLSSTRGYGLQPGEVLLPCDESETARVQIDYDIVNGLMDMGFELDMCKRAVFYTNNSGLENATNWLMEHLDDPTVADIFVIPESADNPDFVADESLVLSIMNLGCSRERALKALRETNNNVERAADWILANAFTLDVEECKDESKDEEMPCTSSSCDDIQMKEPPKPVAKYSGPIRYRLLAFISHMGPSTTVGHYVCHIRRGDKWVIYNDEKVAISENPPKDLGYVYFFEKINN